uniref:Uncharacterized protein n=1 Tax=Octopus bimaculoides TaxID=37653 RepID=A0A0L8HXA6_OCTBM
MSMFRVNTTKLSYFMKYSILYNLDSLKNKFNFVYSTTDIPREMCAQTTYLSIKVN